VQPFAGFLLHEHLLSSLQRFGMGFGLAVPWAFRWGC
jgi:hypothetical protein